MSLSFRSVASASMLTAAVLASIATSNSPPTPPGTPTEDLLPIQPQAPYTDAEWLEPGASITVGFAIGVDDLAGLLNAFSQVQAAGLVYGENTDVRIEISGPAGTAQDLLATEPAFPTDERNVFVEDPFFGCLVSSGTCWSSGWTATWTNLGTEVTELHYVVDVFATNGVATQLVLQ